MKKQPNWYPLDMLPTYVNLSHEQLDAAKHQLQNLSSCKDRPYILDAQTVNGIIKACNIQNESIWVYTEQCNKWRYQSPNNNQLNSITTLENNAKQIAATNNQILALINNNFKNHTIDSILEKSDFELGLDILSGKLNFDK